MTDQQLPNEKTLLQQVEDDLVKHIIAGLLANNISAEDAQKLAAEFLIQLPANNKEDLLNKLNELGKTYTPAREAYVDVIGGYEQQKKDTMLTAMRDHIKSGNIDAALAIAKGGK